MPPRLDAVSGTDGEGRPEITLTYKFNPHDPDPKRIFIKKMRSVGDFHSERIPAYYNLDPGDPVGDPDAEPPVRPRVPGITIIAAPGVSVELFNFPDAWVASEEVPRLDVIRVQNPRLVPLLGSTFSLSGLLDDYFVDTAPRADVAAMGGLHADPPEDPAEEAAGEEEPEETGEGEGPPPDAADPEETSGTPGDSDWSRAYAGCFDSRTASDAERENYLFGLFANLFSTEVVRMEFEPMRLISGDSPVHFESEFLSSPSLIQVLHQPNGVIFTHPYSSQTLTLEFPQLHRTMSTEERADHLARFAYRINPPDTNRGGQVMPLVSIVKTSNVRATLSGIEPGIVVGRERLREMARRSLVFFSIRDTYFNNVPPQGAPLPSRALRRSSIAYVPDPRLEVLQTLMDISIGMIPYVGDAVDIAEFFYALSTDRDRWGRRVSTLEKVLMGVGAVLPFVGSAALRAAPRVAGMVGRGRAAFTRLERGITAARFTDEETAFLMEMEQTLNRGGRLTMEQLARAQELIRRMPPCHA